MARRQFHDAFPGVVINRQSVNVPSIAAAGVGTLAVTVPGAKVGDLVLIQSDNSWGNLGYNARVTAADTVTISFQNPTAGAIDPAAAFATIVCLSPNPL